MEDHQIIAELRERTARVEVKIDYVISHMESLPASPETLAHLKEIKDTIKEHTDFITNLKAKLAIVGAGFVLFGSIVTYGIKWVLEHITVGWGN